MSKFIRTGAMAMVLAAGFAGAAWAEDAPAAAADAQTPAAAADAPTPAVVTQDANNAAAPVAGANSFTEGQVTDRLKEKGITEVTGLAKDADGIWRGKGMQNGKSVTVALDYQGNIFAN